MCRSSLVTAVLVLLGIVAVSIWWIERDSAPSSGRAESTIAEKSEGSSATPKERKLAPESARSAERLKDDLITVSEIAETARSLNAPDASAEDDLEIIHSLIEFFRKLNNGLNPGGGLNEEIVDQLRGRNAKRFAVIPPDLPCINSEGQLLDRWGTPYFFHPVSGKEMEIRSAGPDRRFWTSDDVY